MRTILVRIVKWFTDLWHNIKEVEAQIAIEKQRHWLFDVELPAVADMHVIKSDCVDLLNSVRIKEKNYPVGSTPASRNFYRTWYYSQDLNVILINLVQDCVFLKDYSSDHFPQCIPTGLIFSSIPVAMIEQPKPSTPDYF